ncbi:hypothetical protein GCM10023206_20200 [Acinetobacter puyangensis]|uniref:Homeodomain-like domain-containing protein n=1 Tax=Acinetobacter puyangensis TaxID=1096779 RepID=A0A240ECC4_9GAMM|nr:helix-turn-helix domain-containing protein [Acinetobacter puyangensis]SNX46201.1 Homeodomain-like domain-containing protein [Acinetobacter puyangensis]
MSEKICKYEITAYNFEKLSTQEESLRAKIRLLILHQYSLGKTTSEISESMHISKQIVWKIHRKYLHLGLFSIYGEPHLKGKPLDAFNLWIIAEQDKRRERGLICVDTVELAKMRYEALCKRDDISHVVQRIGADWISTLHL